MQEHDITWMKQAFAEAVLAVGTSRPNPAVGAILVKNGVVVGRGRTQRPGSHHAEIMALQQAGDAAQGADMYVTLEPCCHWGRTPPCSDAILRAQVNRVFISAIDGNPKVSGGGVERLRVGGIPVETGVLAAEGEEFYRGYHHHMKTGLPWVDVKFAQSLDGYIAGPLGERTQITGLQTAEWVHRFRARVDAIVIGGGTAQHDDPQLTVRGVPGNHPVRIVMHRRSVLSENLHVFQDHLAPTILYARSQNLVLPEAVQCMPWPSDDFSAAWRALLAELGAQGFHRILLEAGAAMARMVLSEPWAWNRLLLLTAPKILGKGLDWKGGMAQGWNESLHLSRFELIGNDYLAEFANVHGNHSSSWDRS